MRDWKLNASSKMFCVINVDMKVVYQFGYAIGSIGKVVGIEAILKI